MFLATNAVASGSLINQLQLDVLVTKAFHLSQEISQLQEICYVSHGKVVQTECTRP